MIKHTAKEKRFIAFVKRKCKENGIKCELRPVKYLRLSGNIKCSGYFDENEGKLVVAMNRVDWIEILAHEYCHLTQWVEGVDVYKLGSIGCGIVDSWLGGNEVPGIEVWLGFNRDMELDNEKRTVALIKKWGLNVDIDLYIKKSNAYVQFYNYIGYTRRWSKPGNSPYLNKRVIDAMPNQFRMNYNKMSKKLYKLFIDEGI